MVACGSSNENEKSNANPVHQSSAMRIREPLSRACTEPLARFTLHATISGSIHDANAPQNIKRKWVPRKKAQGAILKSLERANVYKPGSALLAMELSQVESYGTPLRVALRGRFRLTKSCNTSVTDISATLAKNSFNFYKLREKVLSL